MTDEDYVPRSRAAAKEWFEECCYPYPYVHGPNTRLLFAFKRLGIKTVSPSVIYGLGREMDPEKTMIKCPTGYLLSPDQVRELRAAKETASPSKGEITRLISLKVNR